METGTNVGFLPAGCIPSSSSPEKHVHRFIWQEDHARSQKHQRAEVEGLTEPMAHSGLHSSQLKLQ